MRKRTIGILATSIAICALCVATDMLAFGRGGGRGGGGFHGGGFHGGGFHGGGFHGGSFQGGGFQGFAAHGFVGHAFGRNGFAFGHHGFHGFAGWAGPVFWPFLYGDIFSFALWPYDYYDPFWAFGPDFVLASIFAPGPYFGLDYGYGPDYYGYAGSPDIYYGYAGAQRTSSRSRDAAAVQTCSGLAPGATGLPIDQIRQTVHPSADQAAALDDLSSASSQANDIVKASCPSELPLTPVGRLDAAEKRLGAMIQAVQIVRSPLEKLYASLSDEQKQRFDAMGSSGREGAERGSAATVGNLASLCGQQAGGVANLPVQRIEQVVKPNAQQQDAFDALKKASENAADQFGASCPAQMPQTLVARLDAVQRRLSALVEAMKNVRPKLQGFYASLSDEQKARFNTMGPPPQNVQH